MTNSKGTYLRHSTTKCSTIRLIEMLFLLRLLLLVQYFGWLALEALVSIVLSVSLDYHYYYYYYQHHHRSGCQLQRRFREWMIRRIGKVFNANLRVKWGHVWRCYMDQINALRSWSSNYLYAVAAAHPMLAQLLCVGLVTGPTTHVLCLGKGQRGGRRQDKVAGRFRFSLIVIPETREWISLAARTKLFN